MRRRIVLSVLMGMAAAPAFAADLAATSHIVAVTVYADRATVTREAEIDLPAGASTVTFANLPDTLDTNSLRAQGMAAAPVTLGAVDSAVHNEARLAIPREQALEKQLQDLQDKSDLLQADVNANEARKTFLASLSKGPAPATAGRSQPGPDEPPDRSGLKPTEWNAAANALYSGMDDSLKLEVAQRIALRQLRQQIDAVSAEMRSATGARASIGVSVPLEASAATRLTLRIVYQVPRATWTPLYDARLDTKTGKLDLTEYATVRQSTGEDWTDVALTLSTAQPSQGAVAPAVQTQWVDLMQRRGVSNELQRSYAQAKQDDSGRLDEPVGANAALKSMPYPGNDASKAALGGMASAPGPMPAPAPVAAGFAPAQVSNGGYVAEFHIVGPATILPDDSEKRVMIGQAKADATVVDQVQPARDAKAYLVARVTLGGDAPLLPGQANLFRDGSYIGTAALPLLQPGEDTPLGFGIDDQLVVKRQVAGNTKGSAGTFSRQDTQQRRVVTHLHNLHKMPLHVEVREALPVARNDRITVDILKDDTTSDYTKDVDNATGVALWKLDLAPDATGDVKLGWRVSWPADETVVGLP